MSTTFLEKANWPAFTLPDVPDLADDDALLAYFAFLINRRIEEGMNQEEIADKCSVSTATISDIKNKKQTGLRLHNAVTMARALADKGLAETIKLAREWSAGKPASLVDVSATRTGEKFMAQTRADKQGSAPAKKRGKP